LLIQTTCSNLPTKENRMRKHLRPFFLSNTVNYLDTNPFFERMYLDDLRFSINKFRFKHQYILKEITNNYYSTYREYIPFTLDELGE